MDENELLGLARQGDLRAFNALVQAVQDDAFTLACYLCGDDQRAAALVESALVQAYRGLPNRRGETFRAWLLGCVIRACPHSQFKKTTQPFLPGERGDLPSALAGLPAECRLALLLVDLLGLDLPEAAQAAHCSLSKLNALLTRGRRGLIQALPA